MPFSRVLAIWLKFYLCATAVSWEVSEKPVKSILSQRCKVLATPLLHHFWESLEMTLKWENEEMAVSNRKKAAISFYRKMCLIYTDIIKIEEGK